MNHIELGKLGEDRAVAYLESIDYIVLDRNYRYYRAEIDIVASRERTIVFVEVKTRRNNSFGKPEDSVNNSKRRQLFKVARAWMHERNMENSSIRFDVISVLMPCRESEQIEHIKGAFWYL